MTRLIRWLALMCLASPAAAQGTDSLFVGVLRADGIAVPYAMYSAGEWTWLPWDSVPAAIHRRSGEPWHLVRPDQPQLAIRGGSVIRFTGGDAMYEEWGLVTDFGPREVADGSFPIDRVGAILSRTESAVAFARVDLDSAVAERHLSFLRPHFENAETRALRADAADDEAGRGRLGHPRAPDARGRARLSLVQLHRSAGPVGDGHLSYAVLRRVYPVPSDGGVACDAITELGAWVSERDGELSLIEDALTLDSCTEMQLSIATPYVALVLGERTFVLAEYSAYEGSSHAVLALEEGQLIDTLPARW